MVFGGWYGHACRGELFAGHAWGMAEVVELPYRAGAGCCGWRWQNLDWRAGVHVATAERGAWKPTLREEQVGVCWADAAVVWGKGTRDTPVSWPCRRGLGGVLSVQRGFGELVTNNGLLAAWPCTVHDAQGRAWQTETAGLVLASTQAGREGKL